MAMPRESVPRQVIRSLGSPGKNKWLPPTTFLSLSHIKLFFFKPATDDYTTKTQFKLCTKDYITTMYPA